MRDNESMIFCSRCDMSRDLCACVMYEDGHRPQVRQSSPIVLNALRRIGKDRAARREADRIHEQRHEEARAYRDRKAGVR